MKLFNVTGGDSVLGISLTTLALLYYPIGFFYFNSIPIGKIFKKKAYKGLTVLRGIGSFGGGLIFSILCIGILFKLLQLPGAKFMLSTGSALGLLFLIIILIKYLMNKESAFLKSMAIRATLIVGLAFILFVTPGLTLVKLFYRNNTEYIKAYEQAARNPDDKALQLKAEEARKEGSH